MSSSPDACSGGGDERARAPSGRPLDRRRVVALAAVLLLLHVPWLGEVAQNGDSAAYNEQVEQRDVSIRTTHIGYVALAVAVDAVAPGSADLATNLLCMLFGVLGLLAVGWLAWRISDSRALALLSILMAAGLTSYARGSLLSEVDVVLAALVALAVALAVAGRAVAAGVAYGVAMLVSPLAALSLPVFLLLGEVTGRDGRPGLRAWLARVARFGVAGLVVWAPVAWWHAEDYFYGGRGIFGAPRQALEPLRGLERSAAFFWHEAAPALPLALAGLLAVWLWQPLRPWRGLAWGLLASVVLAALVGERFLDVPVQLPHALLALALAAAGGVGSRGRPSAWTMAMLACGLLMAVPTRLAVHADLARREEHRAMFLDIKAQSGALDPWLVGVLDSWDHGLPFERTVYGRTRLGRGLSTPQFQRDIPRVLRATEDYAIWLWRPLTDAALAPLLDRYERQVREVRGRKLDVLLPRRP